MKHLIEANELKSIVGGKGINVSVPLPIPSWPELLNGICGFVDGWNGKPYKGSC